MDRYYRIKYPFRNSTFILTSPYTFEEMVKIYGDELICEESATGQTLAINYSQTTMAEMNAALLEMTNGNVYEIHQKIYRLHEAEIKRLAAFKHNETHWYRVLMEGTYSNFSSNLDFEQMREKFGDRFVGELNRDLEIIKPNLPKDIMAELDLRDLEAIVYKGVVTTRPKDRQVMPEYNKNIDDLQYVNPKTLHDRNQALAHYLPKRETTALEEAIESQTPITPEDVGIKMDNINNGYVKRYNVQINDSTYFAYANKWQVPECDEIYGKDNGVWINPAKSEEPSVVSSETTEHGGYISTHTVYDNGDHCFSTAPKSLGQVAQPIEKIELKGKSKIFYEEDRLRLEKLAGIAKRMPKAPRFMKSHDIIDFGTAIDSFVIRNTRRIVDTIDDFKHPATMLDLYGQNTSAFSLNVKAIFDATYVSLMESEYYIADNTEDGKLHLSYKPHNADDLVPFLTIKTIGVNYLIELH